MQKYVVVLGRLSALIRPHLCSGIRADWKLFCSIKPYSNVFFATWNCATVEQKLHSIMECMHSDINNQTCFTWYSVYTLYFLYILCIKAVTFCYKPDKFFLKIFWNYLIAWYMLWCTVRLFFMWCCWGKLQDPEMQHLLIDSENCSVSLNSNAVVTGEGRHGTSAISFLGALRIPVSTCAVLACSSKN